MGEVERLEKCEEGDSVGPGDWMSVVREGCK